MSNNSSRVFTVREQLKNIYRGAKGFVLLRTSRKKRIMNKMFKERIMLAITEVNGCTMCSYVHTKIALSSGMSKDDILKILDGDSSNIPVNEAVAIIFGQNFAYSKENPGEEAIDRLIEDYGFEKSNLILAACNMITMTNGMGTSMDFFYNRLRFKRNKKSNLIIEILNPLLTMLLFPFFTLYFYVFHFFANIQIIKQKKLIVE